MLGLAARGCCALFSSDFFAQWTYVSLQRSIWLGVFWLVTYVWRKCTINYDGKGVCQRGTDMVAEESERKLVNHSNDDLPLHEKVVCPFFKGGEVHVQDFFEGFPRHVNVYFRGQSAFGYFPPSSTVGVGNETGVLTNTRALAHLSATAWLIGLCPAFLHTHRC